MCWMLHTKSFKKIKKRRTFVVSVYFVNRVCNIFEKKKLHNYFMFKTLRFARKVGQTKNHFPVVPKSLGRFVRKLINEF